MRIVNFAASVFLGAVMAASAAHASDNAKPLQTDAIRSEQAKIKAGVDSRSGGYKELPAATREQLLAHQAQVLVLIEGKKSTAELDDSQKGELFAALESIDAIVTKANDERMVCELHKTLGSNKKERVCRSVKQIRNEREAARGQLDRAQGGRGG